MASDRGISFAQVLLQADIGQRVLPEDGLGIQVGGHESTLSRQSLQEKVDDKNRVFSSFWYIMYLGRRKAFHVGGLEETGQIVC